MIEKQRKLYILCKPLSDYLAENYDPHCTVIVTDSSIKLVRDEIGIPINKGDK